MTAGSAAQVLLAWDEPDRVTRGLRGARFTATSLAQVRRRGWAASVAEREAGVASVSAPVRGQGGKIIAAVSVSGPIERLTRAPGRLHAAAVVAAGEKITALLRRAALSRRAVPRPRPSSMITDDFVRIAQRSVRDHGDEAVGPLWRATIWACVH
jgi:hypothetical protein